MNKLIQKLPPALQGRNYQLYFLGQFASSAGGYLQSAVLGVLVDHLTHSAAMVGRVAMCTVLPGFFLSPTLGGIIVDQKKTRNILYWVQFLGMVQAIGLSYLYLSGKMTVDKIFALSLFLGVVNSVDGPARHVLILEVIRKIEELGSAKALNGVLVNFSQVVGPALSGVLILLVGVAGTFVLNALSFLAMIIAMMAMKLPDKKKGGGHPVKMFLVGVRYVLSEKTILKGFLLMGAVGFFGFSARIVMPVVAREVYGATTTVAQAAITGYLLGTIALGSMVGGIVLSKLDSTMKRLTAPSIIVSGIALTAFSATKSLPWGVVFLFIGGACYAMSFQAIRIAINQHVQNKRQEMLGRVLGFEFMVFFTIIALSSFAAGTFADYVGSAQSIRVTGELATLTGTLLFLKELNVSLNPVPAT